MDENQRFRKFLETTTTTELSKFAGRINTGDLAQLHNTWLNFILLRNCPHCGHHHWSARFHQEGASVVSRWIYQCEDCRKHWGNVQVDWPPMGARSRSCWGLLK
jgi:DNA-directed RNA polymerase subunit M/transcription elongation factor TFIIS